MAGGANKNRCMREQNSGSSGPSSVGDGDSRTNPARTSDRSTPYSIGGRYDGPKDSHRSPNAVDIRLLELSFGMMNVARSGVPISGNLPSRSPRPCSLGREVAIQLNTFHVLEFPSKPVHQYDIVISNTGSSKGNVPRMVISKVWQSKAVHDKLGYGWIYDGNKLAWSLTELSHNQIVINVDLDLEEGRQRSSGKNAFRVAIKYVGAIDFASLRAYLAGKCDFNPGILEAMSFMDHLMRELPSQKYTQIKNSFFSRSDARAALGSGVEALKGVFASMRMVHTGFATGPCLSINVDVANGTFLTSMDLIDMMRELCRLRTPVDLQTAFQRARREDWHQSTMYRALKPLTHVSVNKKNIKPVDGQPWPTFKIHRFQNRSPYDVTFSLDERDGEGNIINSKKITIADYFRTKYNIFCARDLPVVELTKKGELVPVEALRIPQNQRYRSKLDEKQTSQMIKFAVTLPDERWKAINHGLGMLNWGADQYLKNYGLKISASPAQVKGRVLPTPEVAFLNGKIDARTAGSGRWRIDGKKFNTPNSRPLKVWGVAIVNNGRGACVSKQAADNFFTQFMKVYRTHGGLVEGPPHMMEVNLVKGGEMISDIWNATGNKFQQKPQILFFVVPDRNSDTYLRIKKSCECRYGVVSQVMQSLHVMKAQDQYISNVCMKVNAKLGGSTSKAVGSILAKLDKTFLTTPTMIIGADVSHAAPGVQDQGSMAAITCSMDKFFTRYSALCDTNGNRVEIISTQNIQRLMKRMVEQWMANFKGIVPARVVYYRDGVSSGQYEHVLNQEVADMKDMFRTINPKVQPKFTVIICAKRHHIRFFPQQGDRNKNPLPGTMVESGCTHPFELDFYLAAHSAIKGTSRPVHYHVILNECGFSSEFIQQLTFEHCFQYARSTTPVSMFPAVYYAHLASNRAKAHENKPAVSSGKKETAERRDKENQQQYGTTMSTSDNNLAEIPPLLQMNNSLGIESTMWYI